MFLRRITSLKPILFKPNKLQASACNIIAKKPQASFSLFQSSFNKLHKQSKPKLFNTIQYSFSYSKHITQSTCLNDLELIKTEIPEDSLSFITSLLNKYSTSKGLSFLSEDEVGQLGEIFRAFETFLQHQPLIAVRYSEAHAMCIEKLGGNALPNYIGIFMTKWAANMITEMKPWVEKMERAYEKMATEEPNSELLPICRPIVDLARGVVLHHEGKLDEALKLLEKAIAVFEAPDSPVVFDLPKIYEEMAAIYFKKGDREKALMSCQKAEQAFTEDLRGTNVYANRCYEVASLLWDNRHAQEALQYSTKAFSIMKEDSSTDSEILLKIAKQLGEIYETMEDWNNSLMNFEAALDYYKKNNSEDLKKLSDIYQGMTRVHFGNNNLPKAFEAFDKAKDVEAQIYGSESQEVLELLNHWGRMLNQREETRENGKECFETVLNILKKQSPQDNERISHTLLLLGQLYDWQKKTPEAFQAWKECEEYLKKMPQPNPETAGKLLNFKGWTEYREGNWEESIRLWKKAREVPGVRENVVGDSWFNEGFAYLEKDRPQEAFAALSEAMELYLMVYGPEKRESKRCMELLMSIMQTQGWDKGFPKGGL